MKYTQITTKNYKILKSLFLKTTVIEQNDLNNIFLVFNKPRNKYKYNSYIYKNDLFIVCKNCTLKAFIFTWFVCTISLNGC